MVRVVDTPTVAVRDIPGLLPATHPHQHVGDGHRAFPHGSMGKQIDQRPAQLLVQDDILP